MKEWKGLLQFNEPAPSLDAAQRQFLADVSIRDALIELQAASWSRSWPRVKAARARVTELTGIVDICGPLTAAIQEKKKGDA